MTTIKAVLFDLDGTLIDTAPDFIFVVNTLLKEEGKQPLSDDAIRNSVSHGARALITLAFALQEGDDGFEALKQRLLTLYQKHLADNSRPFDGITALLQKLAEYNIPWGIATNKPALYAMPLVEALAFNPEASCIICPDHVSQPKPHPESMELAGDMLDCKTSEIIYVGDHLRDIDCGRRANSITIAAGYGYIDKDDNIEQWQADHCVKHANEIWPIVLAALSV